MLEAFLLIPVKFIFFYIFGITTGKLFKFDNSSFSEIILSGFFSYYFVFFVICIPFKLLKCSLSSLSYTFIITTFLIMIMSIIKLRNEMIEVLKNFIKYLKSNIPLLTGCILITLSILIPALINNNVIAKWDQGYYIGDVASSVYNNTISCHNSYTGTLLSILDPEYLFETYQNLCAVTCRLTGLHPLLEACTTMITVIIVLYSMIMFRICNLLMNDNKPKTFVMLFILTIVNWYSYNDSSPVSMLYLRAYEGKGILALIILPTVLLYFIKICKLPDSQDDSYKKTLLTICASFGLNMSSLYMIPFLAIGTYGSLLIVKHDKKTFINIVKLVIPFAIMLVVYLVFRKKLYIYI